MRINLKNTDGIFPMPVLLVSTYNENNTVNVMTAAWGMMYDSDQIILNLAEDRKTLKNIKNRGAFTVSIADSNHVKEADYFGIVSGNKVPNKLDNTNLTTEKSEKVDAPIINEIPLCMECEFVEITNAGVIGKVVNVSALSTVITDNKLDIDKVSAIAFDPYTFGYYKVSERVGDAYKSGLEIKNK